MKSSHTGLKRIFKAFSYSYDGFMAAYKSEAAFRQDLAVFVLGAILCIFLPIALPAKLLMVFSLFIILLMELANTAIEVVIDRVGEEYHPLSKIAKDIGSLLVLIAFVNAAVIWGAVLISSFF